VIDDDKGDEGENDKFDVDTVALADAGTGPPILL
jgi:hypothetical protein